VGQGAAALACVLIAVAGRVAAGLIPPVAPPVIATPMRWNPFSETVANLRLGAQDPVVFRSMLAISWMWFFGAVFLSQFPAFAKDVLHGDERVASLLLVLFSVGVGVGSLLCEVLGRRHVEIGLVPLGAIGMSIFSIDLYFASSALPAASSLGLVEFIHQSAHWRLMADLALLALFAGLFSVPMYALIQMRSKPSHRARIIAANNILNALFMIASALLVSALLAAGLSIPQIILVVGILNAVVATYIFSLVPEYLLRFLALVVTRCIYRFRVLNEEFIPLQGPAILVCNHVSFIDPVVMAAASPRPIRFIMDHRIFATPVLGWFFRLAKAIPIASSRENPEIYESAFATARQVLAEGDLLCIFPEGGITRDGKLAEFKGGIMKILQTHPVPVVPVALQNLWGSFFSRIDGAAMSKPFRRGFYNRVNLLVAAPLAPQELTPAALQAAVQDLLDGAPASV
jgi:1-acyl-sn-glycerol-3-phosphate acyltransferase